MNTNANIISCIELLSPEGVTRSNVDYIQSCLGRLMTFACLCGLVFRSACSPSLLLAPFPHPDITLHGALSQLTVDPSECFSHFPGDVQYYWHKGETTTENVVCEVIMTSRSAL